jgi:hypothetical protein
MFLHAAAVEQRMCHLLFHIVLPAPVVCVATLHLAADTAQLEVAVSAGLVPQAHAALHSPGARPPGWQNALAVQLGAASLLIKPAATMNCRRLPVGPRRILLGGSGGFGARRRCAGRWVARSSSAAAALGRVGDSHRDRLSLCYGRLSRERGPLQLVLQSADIGR